MKTNDSKNHKVSIANDMNDINDDGVILIYIILVSGSDQDFSEPKASIMASI